MSSRTVSVVLTAQVQNYLSNMKAAELRTLELERASRTATQQFAAHNAAVTKLGVGMLAVGATAAAGLAIAIKAAADFGAKMAQLQSLSHANASTMRLLSDAAMTVGTAYGFSATQVADAQIELVKAGVSVQAQLGGALKGALTLAAAGQLDVAQATEITTVAMTQFGLSAGKVPHLADLLSAGADKALGSVADLGEGLKNGGLQAHNMGLTIDDTVGLLSAFANAGILGAEAGTQMRSMFLRLQNPTSGAKKVLDEYGISINDASGKFVGITKFAAELHDKLSGLTQAQRNQALATVFGSHAIVGATVLYQDSGKAAEKAGTSIGDWIRGVNDAGFASAQAAGKMNSLQGDVQKLSAAFQTDLIKAGTAAGGPLRGVVQSATAVTTALGDMDPAVQGGVMAAGALVAGVGLLGGTFLLAVPKVAQMKLALQELGMTGKQTAGLLGKGGGILLAVTSITSALASMAETGTASTQQISRAGTSITHGWAGVDKLFGSAGSSINSGSGLKKSLDELAGGAGQAAKSFDGAVVHISNFSAVYKANEATLDAMGQQLAGLAQQDYGKSTQSFDQLVQRYKLTGAETKQLLASMPAYRDELAKQAQAAHVDASDHNLLLIAQGRGAAGAKVLAVAQANAAAATVKQQQTLADLAGQASTATTNIDALQKTIEGFGSAQLDARAATRAMYQAIDTATAAANKNGRTLDVHTQAGRDNAAALDGIATAADAAASKTLKQTGDAAKAAAVMATGRAAYIKAAGAMGLSASKAAALADQLGLIPSNVNVAVKTTGFDQAKHDADVLSGRINNLNGTTATVYAKLRTIGMTDAQASQTARNVRFADGGAVGGAGPKGVDSVPAVLAPGEHVLTTRDVDRLGGQGGVYAFRSALAAGDVQGYARGGAVRKRRARGADSTDPSGIVVQDNRVKALQRAITRNDAASIRRAQATEKARQKAEAAAQKRYDSIGSGRKDAAAKRQARAALNTAKARERAAAAAVTKAEKTRTDDIAKRDAARASAAQLRLNREDFVSAERRDPNRRITDPLAYVDQLRQMSRDGDYTGGRRKAFDVAANKYEAALVKLSASSVAAAAKLDGLKQSSVQLHDTIAQSVEGRYSLAGAGAQQTAGGWIMRNGIRLQTTTTGYSAASIASYYTAGGRSASTFAGQLAQLAKRGLKPALLTQLAQEADGPALATALLSGSASQLAAVNAGFTAIGTAAGRAGTTVADDNYAKQIAEAQKNADKITAQIKTDGEQLRKLIARAFGLKGYASGTPSADGGIRWVGEDGPELVGFHGGEAVLNRSDSARWVRGAAGSPAAAAAPVEVNVAPFPDTITVQDASGFTATMRVVAHQVVSQRNDQIAVRVMGAA